jgi:tetratricopeptide (TPR) repeat protein
MNSDEKSSEKPGQGRQSKAKGHWGRRHRRLKRAATLSASILVLGAVLGYMAFVRGRTEVRRPDEKLDDITSKLSKNIPAEAPMPTFTEVTSEAGLDQFKTFVGSRTSQLPEDMGAGAAWGDFDNDGDDDLFLVSAGGSMSLAPEEWAPSELYQNQGDGTFRRVEDFPETRIVGMAAAWGDYDGDGWLDLAVSGYESLLLFRNDRGKLIPDPHFEAPDGYWSGLAWGDFDNDRDLDLYVCGYVEYEVRTRQPGGVTEQYGAKVPYTLNPASFEPASNLLLKNEDGRFENVAELHGVSNPGGRSLSALWHDFDQNGWLDLYVANDISDNALYLNRAGEFEDAGLAAWVADYRGAMGLATGDWNRDGDDDLFVTHWVAQENALYDSRLMDFARAPVEAGESPQEAAADKAQAPRLSFADEGVRLGVGQISLQTVGWGVDFADFDGDGWLDLAIANGSTIEMEGIPKRLEPQPMMLLWNQAGKHFHDLAPLNPVLAAPRVSRGLALSDYDRDGDMDILVVQLDGGVILLRNEVQAGNWLELRLRNRLPGSETGSGSNAWGWGEGAMVTARAGDILFRRSVSGTSYLSQSSRILHFGLGDAESIDSLDVQWLGGEKQSFGSLRANTLWELNEGESEAVEISLAGVLSERERIAAFWKIQRNAMDLVKIKGDCVGAMDFFRSALELNPRHEDSRYYLANCHALEGEIGPALEELGILIEMNPSSHRGLKQWGILRARSAKSVEDLSLAEEYLERALQVNQEETGSLLAMGEVALMLGKLDVAEERLELACQTNPKAVGGFFLRSYLAWIRSEDESAMELLRYAVEARGPEWKPEGAVAEGDVLGRMHIEVTPLSRFWNDWNGVLSPEMAFSALREFLAATPGAQDL